VSRLDTQSAVENGITQQHNGDDVLGTSSIQPPSAIEQPQVSANGNGDTDPDPEIDTDSSNHHQVDSESTQAQTDAKASSPHAAKPCSNNHKPDHMPDHAVVRLIERADKSAGRLVNLLVTHFPSSFRDEARFDGRRVKLFKRAQIFVADLWAALNAGGLGEFGDVDHLTMFPDYRVAQMLYGLGVLSYSPPLDYRVNNGIPIDSGHSWEVQIRGCSIWAVELLRREIVKNHP